MFAEIITGWQIPRLEDSTAAESHAKQRKKLMTVCSSGTWPSREHGISCVSGERPLRQKTRPVLWFLPHPLQPKMRVFLSTASSASDAPGEAFTLLFWTDTGVRSLASFVPCARWWSEFRGPSGDPSVPGQALHSRDTVGVFSSTAAPLSPCRTRPLTETLGLRVQGRPERKRKPRRPEQTGPPSPHGQP